MRNIIIIALLVLSGCSMSNEEVIEQHNICVSAGMGTTLLKNRYGRVRDVVCAPSESGSVEVKKYGYRED